MIKEEILEKIKAGARVKVFSAVTQGPAPAKKSSKKESAAKRESAGSSFEGLVIARKHGKESGATFTVRKVVAGVGVEKIFPIHSPTINKVEILSSPKKIHRSKLYFLRTISKKKARQKLGVKV